MTHTPTDPRHALRHILNLIDRDAPRDDIRAAADRMVGAWAAEFFGWARNRPEPEIFGREVFFEDTPDKRWWVLCTEGDDEVTLIGADGRIGRWDCDQPESLLVRPGGTRLAVPPVPPLATALASQTVRTVQEIDALPDGSVLAAGSKTWQRAYDGWLICDGDDPVPSYDVAYRADRFTVLREGWGV